MNFDKSVYQGKPSTLCKGCGHDSITAALIYSLFDLQIDPHDIIKISGIGCSSKTPNYFSNESFGFNSIHGRMSGLATGIHLSQPTAKMIGVSGDGDTASIGLGGFLHLVRRNVPIVYIIANNGVYGLTKGQFSATSFKNDVAKSKQVQNLNDLDMCFHALASGCGFVARGFSGDQKLLRSILKAALLHKGTSVIDIVSPCVVYGNHNSFNKSYTQTQEINTPLHEIDLIKEATLDNTSSLNSEDSSHNATNSYGTDVTLKITPLKNYDPYSLENAFALLLKEKKSFSEGSPLLHTGILYHEGKQKTLSEAYGFSLKNKFSFAKEDLRITKKDFNTFNEEAKA